MKIYISGRISGLPVEDVEAKFRRAEYLLEDIGVQPVSPLKNGLNRNCSWKQHIVRDIELLMDCDGIMMLSTWKDSKGAGIEYYIAKAQGMKILFETVIAHEYEVVTKIQNAIYEATGMEFDYYSSQRRFRDGFFARVIFAYHCRQNSIDISRYIRRDRTIIYHYLNTYETEMKYNPAFRQMAVAVNGILSQNSSLALLQCINVE